MNIKQIKYVAAHKLWLAAAAAGLVTFVIALVIGRKQSVWFDEAYSIMIAHQPIRKLIHFTSVDTHPPLYYLTLKLWTSLFGNGDLVLRSLSAIFGGISSFAAILLVGRMYGKRVAYIGMPFIVLSPLLLRYDFEIRMYAMAAMWCVVGTYAMVRGLQAKTAVNQRRWWLLYAICILGGAFTFYYTIFVWIAHAMWLMVRLKAARHDSSLKFPSDSHGKFLARQPWLVVYSISAIVFAFWLPVVLKQVSNIQGGFWIGPVSYYKVVTIFTFMTSYRAEWQITPWQSVFIFGSIGLAGWLVVAAYHRSNSLERWYSGLLWLYFLVPIAVMYLLSLPPRQPVFLERYATQAILAGYMLIASAAGIMWTKRRYYVHKAVTIGIAILLLSGVFQLATMGNYNYQQLHKPATKTVAQYIRQELQPTDTVVLQGAGAYIEYDHYLPETQLRFNYPYPNLPTTGGYAIVHDSPNYLQDSAQLASNRVWYVHATQNYLSLHMPPIYNVVHETGFDSTTVTLYQKF